MKHIFGLVTTTLSCGNKVSLALGFVLFLGFLFSPFVTLKRLEKP